MWIMHSMCIICLLRAEYKEDIMCSTHKIIKVKGHYEVYDDNGNFVLSGDTWNECYNDLLAMIVVGAKEKIENVRGAIAT